MGGSRSEGRKRLTSGRTDRLAEGGREVGRVGGWVVVWLGGGERGTECPSKGNGLGRSGDGEVKGERDLRVD